MTIAFPRPSVTTPTLARATAIGAAAALASLALEPLALHGLGARAPGFAPVLFIARTCTAVATIACLALAFRLQRVRSSPLSPTRSRVLGWVLALLAVARAALVVARSSIVDEPPFTPLVALERGVAVAVVALLVVLLSQLASAPATQPGSPLVQPGFVSERLGPALLAALVALQLVLGPGVGWLQLVLYTHVLIAVALLLPFAIHLGVRALLVDTAPARARLSLGLAAALLFQFVLGISALVLGSDRYFLDTAAALLHRWLALAVLVLAVALTCSPASPKRLAC